MHYVFTVHFVSKVSVGLILTAVLTFIELTL